MLTSEPHATPRRRALTLALAFALCIAPAAGAQVRASERGTVSQTVDGTTITIDYSRPQARGRANLFGGVVRLGEPWTPGANWATTFTTDKPVHIGGSDVPAGTYSMWMIPSRDSFTVILHTDAHRFHTQKPGREGELLRLAVKPESLPPVEILTFSFPAVSATGTTLRMQWGSTAVPIHVRVEPSRAMTLGPAQRSRYVGTYDIQGDGSAAGPPPGSTFEVFESGDQLRARWNPGMGPDAFELIPIGSDRFVVGFYEKGKLVDVESEMTVVFDVEDGRATAFRVLGIDDAPMGRGTRAKQ